MLNNDVRRMRVLIPLLKGRSCSAEDFAYLDKPNVIQRDLEALSSCPELEMTEYERNGRMYYRIEAKGLIERFANAPKMKKCSRCWDVKSIDEFNSDRTKADGKSYMCTECSRQRQKDLKAQNVERIRQQKRRWSQKNRVRLNAYRRAYYARTHGRKHRSKYLPQLNMGVE